MEPLSMLFWLILFFVLVTFRACTVADILPPITDCPTPPPSPAPSSSPKPVAASPRPMATDENGVFRSNLAALLDAIPSSASSTGGFASLSKGNGDDRAYVRGLCFGQALGGCQACLINAAANINAGCNSSRRAAIWFEGCFLCYADTNTSTAYEEDYRQELHNRYFVSDKTGFEKTYNSLMSRLVASVVNGSSEEPVPMFATGHAVFDPKAPTTNGTMYGLVQCMRDRTAAECKKCLQDSVPRLPKCCYGNQGGVVVGYNCYLRVEIYTYYDLALDAPPARRPFAPSPTSFMPVTGDSQGKKGQNVILPVALASGTVLFVVGIIVMVFLYERKTKQDQTPAAEDCGNEEDIGNVGLDPVNLPLLRAATDNFSEENKLGKGGFGEVFKV